MTPAISTHPPLAKKHLFWAAFGVGLAFTYAGVDESIWVCLVHPIFLLNLVLNTLYGLLHFHIAYRLHFVHKFSLKKALPISLVGFYLLEMILLSIGDYEPEDYVELYSISLPFGSILVIIVNVIYHLLQQQQTPSPPPTLPTPQEASQIWLDSSKGRVHVQEHEILYAALTETHLEIVTEQQTLRTFYSLKQLGELLRQPQQFFRLNKQYLCNRRAIKSYRSLKDARLEIELEQGKKCLVSKNKASSLKKWLNEAA